MVQSLQSYLLRSLWLLMKIFIAKSWKNGKLYRKLYIMKATFYLDFVKLGTVGSGVLYANVTDY